MKPCAACVKRVREATHHAYDRLRPDPLLTLRPTGHAGRFGASNALCVLASLFCIGHQRRTEPPKRIAMKKGSGAGKTQNQSNVVTRNRGDGRTKHGTRVVLPKFWFCSHAKVWLTSGFVS